MATNESIDEELREMLEILEESDEIEDRENMIRALKKILAEYPGSDSGA